MPVPRVRSALLAAFALTTLLRPVASTALPPEAGASSPSCLGRAATILGTSRSDLLVGTRGPDVIIGRGGSDLILARGGRDVVCGRGGDDEIHGAAAADRIDAGKGDDLVMGESGNDVEVGGGYQDVFAQTRQITKRSADVPKRIPDVGSVVSELRVHHPLPATISDVNVRVCITHPRTQDLSITLFSPHGSRVRLSQRRGNGTAFCNGNARLGIVFDSEEFTTIRAPGSKRLDGRMHPEWSLDDLDGEGANGTWKLLVDDAAGGAGGRLKGWGLELTFPLGHGNGADRIVGESGFDLVDYAGRRSRVTATLDGGADDGGAGEGDALGGSSADVEAVYGGGRRDLLSGSDAHNELRGEGGDDVLRGLGGDDLLDGGSGDDALDGGPGTDALIGGPGSDICTSGETVSSCER